MTRPHVIVQNYAIFQAIQFGVRRAKEGIAELRVGSFKVVKNDIWGYRSWVKVCLARKIKLVLILIFRLSQSHPRTILMIRKPLRTLGRFHI